MKRTRRDTVRRLYREAILEYFGESDHLREAVKRDVHCANKAPGEWVGAHGVLEIYCEGGIPNASDIIEPGWYGLEGPTHYNSDTWAKADDWVNLGLAALGKTDRVHHEPWNSAVIGVYWS